MAGRLSIAEELRAEKDYLFLTNKNELKYLKSGKKVIL